MQTTLLTLESRIISEGVIKHLLYSDNINHCDSIAYLCYLRFLYCLGELKELTKLSNESLLHFARLFNFLPRIAIDFPVGRKVGKSQRNL